MSDGIAEDEYEFIALCCNYAGRSLHCSVAQVLLKQAAVSKHESLIKEYLNGKVIFEYITLKIH